MEKETLTSAMMASISEVLETMFFLPLEFSENVRFEEWLASNKGKVLITKLEFSGPVSGAFLFFMPNDLGLSLAASFMGEDEGSVSKENVSETVKEIINMIAGNTFGIWDDQAVIDLSIPELIGIEEAEKEHGKTGENYFIAITTLEDSLALDVTIQS